MKKSIIICGVLIMVTGIAFAIFSIATQKPLGSLEVSYSPIPGSSVRIVNTSLKIDITAKNSTVYNLEPGTYRVVVSGLNIETQSLLVEIDKKPINKEVTVSYTPAYLSNKLVKEMPNISQVFNMKYPQAQSLYAMKAGSKLYIDGSWFAARLRYTGTDDSRRDTLKLVMHKKDGKWQVVTRPPQIIVSKKTYPSIPHTVVDDINSDEIIKTLGQ